MFKKILNLIKNNKEEKIELKEELEENINICEEEITITEEAFEEENICEIVVDLEDTKIIDTNDELKEDCITSDCNCMEDIDIEEEKNYEFNEEDKQYIKNIKIQRGKGIKAIDVYSNEEIIFNTHQDCSKQLGVPIEYIKENLQYGYTDYFGPAITYLSKKLRVDTSNLKSENKNIVEIFNYVHNELWSENISEQRREDILNSEKIEPINMHYKFEIIDDEYDDYFRTYGKLIRRGGKKRIELIDKKNEVIEVFKSLDDCANFFKKDKSEIIDRLKCGECKIGRYEIKYSLRR